jgi:hypothetical protein
MRAFPLTSCPAPQIDAQIAVRHAEALERTKATKSLAFFGGARDDRDADENVPSRQEDEGMLVSSSVDVTVEPPRKRNKTTPADLDAVEKVRFLFLIVFDMAPTWNTPYAACHGLLWTADNDIHSGQKQASVFAEVGNPCVPRIVQIQRR